MGTETLGSGEDFDYILREMPLALGGGGVGGGGCFKRRDTLLGSLCLSLYKKQSSGKLMMIIITLKSGLCFPLLN